MADNITLAELKRRARERADMENSEFISDSELTSYINTAYLALYDILVSRFEFYYTKQLEFTIPQNEAEFLVPNDFYKLDGLDFKLGAGQDGWTTVTKWNFKERNRNRSLLRLDYRNVNPRQYRLIANKIDIQPKDRAAGDYRLFYTPRATRLANDSDTVDAVNGWEDYIVLVAAMKMLAKEESDISAIVLEIRDIEDRIEAMSQNRDDEPERVTDMNPFGWRQDTWWTDW